MQKNTGEYMEIQFLGGADQVGCLGMVLKARDQTLLFEYGILPSKPPKYPMPAPPVDHVLVTHSHLDHSGMVPWLTHEYLPPIHCTSLTSRVAEVLYHDSLKISDIQGYQKPFTKGDISNCLRSMQPRRVGERFWLDELEMVTHFAGHVPGALMYELRDEKTLLFTGDINTSTTNLVGPAKPVDCDILVVEGTYAGREHPERDQHQQDFLDCVHNVVDRGGVAIIPAFAVGRTQEMMLMLRNSGLDIWLDGMGNTMTRQYLAHPEFLENPKRLKKAKGRMHRVSNPKMREKALDADVIITTSGMLEGGPVLFYLKHLRKNPRNAVIMTGYQVEGTNGARLRDTGTILIDGNEVKVDCTVHSFDFSAHSGHSELLEFIHGCSPKQVVLMHSDNRQALADDLYKEMDVLMPMPGETISLD